MIVSFGIVSYGKPRILKALLDSFSNIDIDVKFEICIFQNNPSENGEKCYNLLMDFKGNNSNIHIVNFTSKNIGFWSCWNCLENIMSGEYRFMIQEDMIFHKHDNITPKVSEMIQYMSKNKYLYMALGGASHGNNFIENYTDWAHIEHKSFRILYGDFDSYPRTSEDLRKQATLPEPRYNTKINKSKEKPQLAVYPERIAACQHQGDSIYQTLIHEFNKLDISEEEKIKVWENPDIDVLKSYNIKIWK